MERKITYISDSSLKLLKIAEKNKYCLLIKEYTIIPYNKYTKVKTCIRFRFPNNCKFLLEAPISLLARKINILEHSYGLNDIEVELHVINFGDKTIYVKKGDILAILTPYKIPDIQVTEDER